MITEPSGSGEVEWVTTMEKEPTRKEAVNWGGLASDHKTWEALMTRFQETVFYVSYALLGNRETAEDNVQDTFMRAYAYFYRHPELVAKVGEAIGAYLCTMAKNGALNKLTKGSYEISLEGEAEDSGLQLTVDEPGFEQIENNEELTHLLAGVSDELNDNTKQCLALWLQGMTAREIATLLGMKERSVATNIYRAKDKLRRIGTKHK